MCDAIHQTTSASVIQIAANLLAPDVLCVVLRINFLDHIEIGNLAKSKAPLSKVQSALAHIAGIILCTKTAEKAHGDTLR